MSEVVLLEKKDRVAIITLNRPDVLNALNLELVLALGEAFDNVAKDDAIGVVILTGAGDKAFAAGADISELVENDALLPRRLTASGLAPFAIKCLTRSRYPSETAVSSGV